MSVRKLEYTQSPSRQGRNVGRKRKPNFVIAVPQGRNVEVVDLLCSPCGTVVRTRLCLVRFILAGCASNKGANAGTACVDRVDKVETCPNSRGKVAAGG
ncbi:MAG: hypothetical protein LBD59_03495 [Prevotellaceae bacterium]|nr:hypothetical protein [Prevotellaceae bacterium]